MSSLVAGPVEHRRNAAQPWPGSDTASAVWYPQWKAIADVALGATLLVAAAPLVAVLVSLVRLTSPGPGLYRQSRLGRRGRPFTLYKVRTMAHDCERSTGPRWSTPGDPRVTRLGRALRRTHLDELPQLWNVVRGEMSLVGPRPERPEIAAQLEHALPDYGYRLAVRPGVTGLAQVQLPADTDLAGVRVKLAYDLCYVERQGPWLDLRVLAATALKILGVPFHVTRRLLALPVPLGEECAPAPEMDQAPRWLANLPNDRAAPEAAG